MKDYFASLRRVSSKYYQATNWAVSCAWLNKKTVVSLESAAFSFQSFYFFKHLRNPVSLRETTCINTPGNTTQDPSSLKDTVTKWKLIFWAVRP
jgi:hypothetical protein